MSTLEDLTRNYRVAFLRYLPRRQESALHSGYELGRSAVVEGVSLLEMARVHHEVLMEVLRDSSDTAQDVPALAAAASEFFLEVLAPYHMTQRGVLGARNQATSTEHQSGGQPAS